MERDQMSEQGQPSRDSQLLNAILDEQKKQTKHLSTISTVMQIFGLLLLLAIAGMICNLLGLI
jgi:hypothetical protein